MRWLRSPASRLFTLGFITLFLELALIRYLAATIWNLGYFPNFVLLAVFVGMGVGFLLNRRISADGSERGLTLAAGTLFALLGFVSLARPAVPGFSTRESNFGGEIFFTAIDAQGRSDLVTALVFITTFLLIVTVFALFSQRTAQLFRLFKPLRAYSLDIGGACLGIVTAMLFSWLQLPPQLWIALLVVVFLLASERIRRLSTGLGVAALLLSLGTVAWEDSQPSTEQEGMVRVESRWSPYQRLELMRPSSGWDIILANGVVHQGLLREQEVASSYAQAPHRVRRQRGEAAFERVLIIGGGTGNDVAAALQSGASEVDVVEIDPGIVAIGRAYHPLAPYADPRVRVIVDDGRAFLRRAQPGYDLIVFALTDSLVKVSALTQLRLENYLFTVEAIQEAFGLLSKDGALVLCNFYRQSWLVEKLVGMMSVGSERKPELIFRSGDFLALQVRRDDAVISTKLGETDWLPVDDWPFLYLRERGVPGLYLKVLVGLAAFIAALWAVLQFYSFDRRQLGVDAPGAGLKLAFLCMGMAFIVLESKSVVQFSLLFGTTWMNASLVFLGVLVSVLLANWVASVLRERRRLVLIVFVALLLSCLLPLSIELGSLLSIESRGLRFLAAALLTFSPLFFANLLFGVIFARQPAAENLFGWNLLGSALGGLVEYTSMATGYSSLAVLVALLYSMGFLGLMLQQRSEGAAAPKKAS